MTLEEELPDLLDELADDHAVGSPPSLDVEYATHQPRPSWRSGVLVGAAVAACIALLVGGLVTLARRDTSTGVSGQPSTSPVPSSPPPQTTVTRSNTATTAAPTPTQATPVATTIQAAVIDRIAIGDSVMLGAANQLTAAGFTVDAVESRQFTNGADLAYTLRSQQRLGDVVVIHLGTNGSIGPEALDTMMTALADVPHVLLVTDGGDMAWTAANNAILYEAAATYDNVELLDWAGLAGTCPGDCLYADGVHLKTDGQIFYTQLIDAAIADGLNN